MGKTILFGEPMALLIADTTGPLENVEHFTRTLSGAEVNVSIGLTRLGHSVEYLTRLGDDPFGHYIAKTLGENQIGISLLSYDPVLSDQEKKVVAYHEIGHALVAAMQTHSAPVQKITIIPRTSGALGYTMQVEQGDKYLLTKQELENKIATFTGGRAAEEVVFGEITTGASNDIEQATKIARAMITRYGMSDDFDMVAMETVTNQYLGGDASLACSADTQNEIDRKVVELVKREHEKAKKILLDNRQKLDELSNYLYEKETITGDEFMAILNGEAKNETNTETKIESGAEKKEADADEQTI